MHFMNAKNENNLQISQKIKIFYLSADILDLQIKEKEINDFINSHNIMSINNYLVGERDIRRVIFIIQYYKDIGPYQKNLYLYLKAWRLKIAKERGIPAYAVFNDTILAEITRVLPKTLNDLSKIKGMGEAKVATFGEILLAEIKGFSWI